MKRLPQIAALSIAATWLIVAVPRAAQTEQERPDELLRNRPRLDPDDAYKNHCMRCHVATPQYSSGRMQTIVTHMRVRANLTKEETDAILEYLTLGEDSGGQEGPQSNERFQVSIGDYPAPTAGTALEQPAATQEPAGTQEASVTPKPPAAEEPLASQNPFATREPLAGQEPAAARESLVLKESAVIHEPSASQKPPATPEPLATREPPTSHSPTAQRPLDTREALVARERPAAATVQGKTASTGPGPAAEFYVEAGFAAFKTRRFEQAEIEFRKAVETDPTSTSARFYLGYTVGMIWMGNRGGKKPLRAAEKPSGTTSTGTAPPAGQEAAAPVAKAYELDMAHWMASPAVAPLRMTLKNGSVLSLKEVLRPSGNRIVICTTDGKLLSIPKSEILSIGPAPRSTFLTRLDTHDARQLGAIARILRKGKPVEVAPRPGTPPLAALSSDFEEPQAATVAR